MASKSVAYRHFQRVLAQWPVDVLRPQVSFQDVMRRRIDKQLGPSTPDQTTYDPAKESKDTLVTPLKPYDEQAQLNQVNALYSLMENRYAKKYPLSDRLLKPLSNPEYYDNLLKELDEAPKRSFFQRLLNSWKGFVRCDASSLISTPSTHSSFSGLKVTFDRPSKDLGIFSSEHIALGFIAGLAEESTKDCNARLPAYSFTYADFPHTALPLTIRMNFLSPDPQENIRGSVNYALVAIPNALLSKKSIEGTTFWEFRRGYVTYSGAFGKLPFHGNPVNKAEVVRSPSLAQGLSNESSPLNVSELFSSSNNEYRFSIDGDGEPIPQNDVFLSSLIYLLELSQANTEALVTEAAFYLPSSPVWFYARGGPQNPMFKLASVSGILKLIATQLVVDRRYREVTWSVRWGEERVIMSGCMCKRVQRPSMMCQGVRGNQGFSRLGAGISKD
ncbi:MAG: hypothetical protein Q9169_001608 [Polycauliona sp. 2 TL-2023]